MEGIGKEYNNDSKLIFEGEYINGKKRNGTEYAYDDFGELIFQIKLINGDIFE